MIILCSSDEKLREHWSKGLTREGESLTVIDDFGDLPSVLNGSNQLLVLLDLDNGKSEPVSLVSAWVAKHPACYLFALTKQPNPGQGIALAQAGIRGYGNSWMHPDTLRQSSRLIQSGEVWLGQEVIQLLIKGVAAGEQPTLRSPITSDGRLSELTARELEISERVAVGESNKLIAYELGITERTVKAHMSNIFQKAEVKDRLQLALLVNNQSH
ncbi:MAG: response regulator transcription factor [Sedimenticola sp.]|nr:response regulator transcription factor [Sedimenticola sp.]